MLGAIRAPNATSDKVLLSHQIQSYPPLTQGRRSLYSCINQSLDVDCSEKGWRKRYRAKCGHSSSLRRGLFQGRVQMGAISSFHKLGKWMLQSWYGPHKTTFSTIPGNQRNALTSIIHTASVCSNVTSPWHSYSSYLGSFFSPALTHTWNSCLLFVS